jgi:uridine kinase
LLFADRQKTLYFNTMSDSSFPEAKKNSFLIGITGGSGSGKTSFIRSLRNRFSASELCILSQDDYYKEREKQATDKNNVRNFDLPESILTDEMVRDIEQLQSGKQVTRMEYVFNNEKAKARNLVFHPAPVILVEGLFVFHHEVLRSRFDLKLFIQAKENLKVIRRIRRDRMERNYPLEDVLYRYEHHVSPAYEKYIEPYKREADMIINNDERYHMALEVISGFIRSLVV